MIPIQAVLVTHHIDELLSSAAAERRAHPADIDVHLTPRGPSAKRDPRKALARVASGISRAAASTARRLDPSTDVRVRTQKAVPTC
ncbi:MAG TPA: hypothetical protein VGI98_05800 [Candidatus Limnocylindrales bacterium]